MKKLKVTGVFYREEYFNAVCRATIHPAWVAELSNGVEVPFANCYEYETVEQAKAGAVKLDWLLNQHQKLSRAEVSSKEGASTRQRETTKEGSKMNIYKILLEVSDRELKLDDMYFEVSDDLADVLESLTYSL